MTSNAKGWAVDTSVAVAVLDAAHLAHEVCRAAWREHRPVLAGHAAFELFSVLTRMPGPLSVDIGDAALLIERAFPQVTWLDPASSADLARRLPSLGITGGAVYDALVGEAARCNGFSLLTRDHRAKRTYDLLGVDYRLVSE